MDRDTHPQVSIILPTLNCANIIRQCLDSIKRQTYSNIELIIVDAQSKDGTDEIAQEYGKVLSFKREPYMAWGTPYQQNFGASKANGKYLYFVDSDMVLPENAIETYVKDIEGANADSMIIPEISYGEGFWAKCKVLERSAYVLEDRSIEAPRFHKKVVWDRLGGLNPDMGGHYDWDIHYRLLENNYKVARSSKPIYHNEGKLTLKWLIKKKFTYGKTFLPYFMKYRHKSELYTSQFNLVRPSYIRNWRALIKDPVHAVGFLVMKSAEAAAFFIGFVYSFLMVKRKD